MFNTLLKNIWCKPFNQCTEPGKAENKTEHTKKSEQLRGKNQFQNIARIKIQLLHKRNITLKWSSKGKGSAFEIKENTHSFLSACRKRAPRRMSWRYVHLWWPATWKEMRDAAETAPPSCVCPHGKCWRTLKFMLLAYEVQLRGTWVWVETFPVPESAQNLWLSEGLLACTQEQDQSITQVVLWRTTTTKKDYNPLGCRSEAVVREHPPQQKPQIFNNLHI